MSLHLDKHLERYMGRIARGWSSKDSPGVQVCLFLKQPFAGAVTYSTLGLSGHVLSLPQARSVRLELIFSVHESAQRDDYSQLLMYVAESIVASHRAVLRGEVIALPSPVAPGSACSHLYVTGPVLFPDEFGEFAGTQPTTILVWLVPITAQECAFVRREGWNRFEDELERTDPDLLDICRRSAVQ